MRIRYRGPPTGAGQGAALRTVPKCELIKPAAAAQRPTCTNVRAPVQGPQREPRAVLVATWVDPADPPIFG